MCRVRAATECTVTVGCLFDAAGGESGSSAEADAYRRVPSVNAPLRLLRNGKTLATGRLDRLGDSPAFVVETTNNH